MGFLRQEYWSGLPFPSPGNLPNPGIEPTFPALAGGFFTTKEAFHFFFTFFVISISLIAIINLDVENGKKNSKKIHLLVGHLDALRL